VPVGFGHGVPFGYYPFGYPTAGTATPDLVENPIDLALDTDGDLLIENGDLVLIAGKEAIAQDLNIRLEFFLGEWFLDTRIGVPYFTEVLGQKPRIGLIQSFFRKVILLTPGITDVSNMLLDYTGSTRVLTVEFWAHTAFGIIKYDKELIV